MITILNRREVYLSLSFEKAAQMRLKIERGGVECLVKCRDLNRGNHRGFAAFAVRPQMEYRLYVHKKDVDLANHLMNQPLNS